MIERLTQATTVEEVEMSNLSPAEISGLVDMVQAQIEYYRDEIARLRPILHRLQGQIPTDSFADFIKDELEIPGEQPPMRYRHHFITPNARFFIWTNYTPREWGIGIKVKIDEGLSVAVQLGPFELSTGIDTSSPF